MTKETNWDDLSQKDRDLLNKCKKQLDTLWDKNIESVIEIGKVLGKIKEKIKKTKGEKWYYFVEKHFPITLRTADRLVSIGESLRIEMHKKILPFSWGTLYELTENRMENKVFTWARKEKRIHRGTTINDLHQIIIDYNNVGKTPKQQQQQKVNDAKWRVSTSFDFLVDKKDVDVKDLEDFRNELKHFVNTYENKLSIRFDLEKLNNVIVEMKNAIVHKDHEDFRNAINKKIDLINRHKTKAEQRTILKCGTYDTVRRTSLLKTLGERPDNDWRKYLPKNKNGKIDRLRVKANFNIPSKVLDDKNIPDLPKEWTGQTQNTKPTHKGQS